MNDNLTENEVTLICYAMLHDESRAKEILKGTELSIRNGVLYRGNKEIATTHINRHKRIR